MLPEQVAPQSGYFIQGIGYDQVENFWYVSMLITGGVQLPGEGAPVSASQRNLNGDLFIAKLNPAGVQVGSMYCKKFGHGQTLGVEHNPSGGAFLWTETDSNLDGPFGTGRKVARFAFADATILEYGVSVIDTYDPLPGKTRLLPSISFDGTKMLVSYLDGSTRFYNVYDFATFKTHAFTPLFSFASPAGIGTLQSCLIHGDFVYLLEGDAYSGGNPLPGNTYHTVVDIRTGNQVQRVLCESRTDLTYREPEGSTVYPGSGGPELVFSFVTHTTDPRSMIFLSHPLAPDTFWHYTTNSVDESPFAWNRLHERFRMPRGISVQEITPGVYEELRFTAYTDELGSLNLPRDTAFQSQEFYKDLNFFRGGYDHVVSGQVRTDLINSGVATSANFVPA